MALGRVTRRHDWYGSRHTKEVTACPRLSAGRRSCCHWRRQVKHCRRPGGSFSSWASRCEETRQRARWRHMSSSCRRCRRAAVRAAQGPGLGRRRLSWRCCRFACQMRGLSQVRRCVISRNTKCVEGWPQLSGSEEVRQAKGDHRRGGVGHCTDLTVSKTVQDCKLRGRRGGEDAGRGKDQRAQLAGRRAGVEGIKMESTDGWKWQERCRCLHGLGRHWTWMAMGGAGHGTKADKSQKRRANKPGEPGAAVAPSAPS
jgi:hypothetical protein